MHFWKKWSNTPKDTLLNLVERLPRRVGVITAAKGGPASWDVTQVHLRVEAGERILLAI